MEGSIWTSPDGDIVKTIIKGTCGLKPTENCKCSIEIPSHRSPMLIKYARCTFTIGDCDTKFERLLDRCLITMCRGEVADVSFKINEGEEIQFSLKLLNFESCSLIHEWDAKMKYDLAVMHKTKGNRLYNNSSHINASCRFGKGLKILCSIPIEVDTVPIEVDGVRVKDIQDLKTIFYNNLASCYLKQRDYKMVLLLCNHVFERDKDNIKALYKQAVAKCETNDYEGSQDSLLHLLMLEPENKAAAEKLKFVNIKIKEANTRSNNIIKKMFK